MEEHTSQTAENTENRPPSEKQTPHPTVEDQHPANQPAEEHVEHPHTDQAQPTEVVPNSEGHHEPSQTKPEEKPEEQPQEGEQKPTEETKLEEAPQPENGPTAEQGQENQQPSEQLPQVVEPPLREDPDLEPEDDEHEYKIIDDTEEIPEEEYINIKIEHFKNNPDDENDPPRTRAIRRKIRVKKDKLLSPEKEGDDLADDPIVVFIREKVEELNKFEIHLWNRVHSRIAKSFATDGKKDKIFFWIDEHGLNYNEDDPPQLHQDSYDSDFVYILKNPSERGEINADTITKMFFWGSVGPDDLRMLCNSMQTQYINAFTTDHTWPENIKKEFTSYLHRFMATITDVQSQREGQTKLYIPKENLSNKNAAIQDKDLIQRLEMILSCWSKQIKDIVNNQESLNDSELTGPIEEINYWKQRQDNLEQINQQLKEPALKIILEILGAAESASLKSFNDQSTSIQNGYTEAKDNLYYLNSLLAPCKELEEAKVKDIPKILPQMLHRVRMISEESKYYSNPDRIAGLLRKISNEIIKRCKLQISLKDLLDGNVEKCMEDLKDSKECCDKWQTIYKKVETLIKKKGNNKNWDLKEGIFAQLQAFMRRCDDLLEICEGQLQFARSGANAQMPVFGGRKGMEIILALEENKNRFNKFLDRIKQTKQEKILDIKSTDWHDEYNIFRNGMKDLDNMYDKIIQSAFENVRTVEQGVEMLEAFESLAKRDAIRMSVERQVTSVLKRFGDELDKTKIEYERITNNKSNNNSYRFAYGKYSGMALWVRSLIQRITRLKDHIDKLVFVKPETKKPFIIQYETLHSQLKHTFLIQQKFVEWKNEIGGLTDLQTLEGLLNHPFLIRAERVEVKCNSERVQKYTLKPQQLESNFSKILMRMMVETQGWEKIAAQMGLVIPSHIQEFVQVRKEPLRIHRDYVMNVVREYNNIIDDMDAEFILINPEKKKYFDIKKLFAEHLQETDTLISHNGERRIKFSSKNVLEKTVKDCIKSCNKLQGNLNSFKEHTRAIYEKCKQISEEKFIDLEEQNAVEPKIFEYTQEVRIKQVTVTLKQKFEDIRALLSQIYELFYRQNDEIQKVFFDYVEHIDKKVEDSLRKAIRNSLQLFNRTINGEDNSTIAVAIFKLKVVLDGIDITFDPTPQELQDKVRLILTKVNESVTPFPRMEQLMKEDRIKKFGELEKLEREAQGPERPGVARKEIDYSEKKKLPDDLEKKKTPSFLEKIADDKDIQKITNFILKGLKETCDRLKDLKDPWKKHTQKFYTNPKEKFAEALIRRNEPLSTLKAEIERYEGIQNQVTQEKTTEKEKCIQLDNAMIKDQIVDILIQWQNTILQKMQEHVLSEIDKMYKLFKTTADELNPVPTDHRELEKAMSRHSGLMRDKPTLQQSIGPLLEKFDYLKENVNFRDEDEDKKKNLEPEFDNFCKWLDKIQLRNKKKYEEMYADCLKELDEFGKESEELRTHFLDHIPNHTRDISSEQAFNTLAQYKDDVKNLRTTEKNMQFGFTLFGINPPPNADLDFIEKEIESLEKAWNLKAEWENEFKEIEKVKFIEFDMDALDDKVEEYNIKINNFSREMKKWDLVGFMRTELEKFRNTLPLINSLKQDYMRPRHWDKLKFILNKLTLDPLSPNFDLGELWSLNLLAQADNVVSITEVARAEFQIEKTLKKIKDAWGVTELIVEDVHKAHNTLAVLKRQCIEQVNDQISNHKMLLSQLKTNAFFASFADEILEWERDLIKSGETLELFINVQRLWMRLESIIFSQPLDTYKQLSGDITKFNFLNDRVVKHIDSIKRVKNALQCLKKEGFQSDLQDILGKLEEIQKILLQLLDLKRLAFPRFYFLSDDDLFELLGSSKDKEGPKGVNKHIKKCFEGIQELEIQDPAPKGPKVWNVMTMKSPDKELVPLVRPVRAEGGVETWLTSVEKEMVATLKAKLLTTCEGIRKKEVKWIPGWISSNVGQLQILALQIRWTKECYEALERILNNTERVKSWSFFRQEQKKVLETFTVLVQKCTNEIDRLKLVALITIEIHARTVIDELCNKKVESPFAFEWESQLRFKAPPEMGADALNCIVEQTNTKQPHGFEYQGNNGRLVITPLTDRCYLTLTTAMHLKRGGAPQGPAGTGKTETVKDLGKGMGKFVIVFNCQEGLDYKSIGRMFNGLVQTGGWGCFDEFNRIEVDVLSVIATQISSIFNGLRLYREDNPQSQVLKLETGEYKINPGCAIFITMNPGYAGRSELPDNLKSLFRPIAMIVPNSELIAEILLAAEGFKTQEKLAKKVITLYRLMIQQLSKQDHYDFGLRAIKSVLTCAGAIRRAQTMAQEEKKDAKEKQDAIPMNDEKKETYILMKAIRDMNLPKFVAQDIPLFTALFNDLFREEEEEEDMDDAFRDTIEDDMKEQGLQVHDPMVTKVMQLNASINTRHGNMLVGSTLSGKSTCWKTLERTLNRISEQKGKNVQQPVSHEQLNPKSVDLKELYGFVDPNTMEWSKGVLSSLMAAICKKEGDDIRWLIFDGPVDTLWIESMNTVLDDNKVLTLLNGDRINMPRNVSLLFEVEDLSVASPATVSRCGMVYLDINDLGWRPIVDSWVDQKKDPELRAYLDELFDKWISIVLRAKRTCKETVTCLETNLVMSLCKLLDALNVTEPIIKFDNPPKTDEYWQLLDKWFAFAVLWSLGATVNEDGRKIIDYKFRDIESFFPVNNIYDYYINVEKGEFCPWEEKITTTWKPTPDMPFHKFMVPTTDTVRNRYMLNTLIKSKLPTLVVGVTGTGKTAVVDALLNSLDESYTFFYINFSAQTTSHKTQEIIESKLKNWTKTKMVPESNKKAVIFIDDMNMPRKEKFGAQPPLELLRQYMEYGGWYDRQNLDIFKFIIDCQLVSAMGPPGGGRAEITQRIQSKFNVLNFTFPNDLQVRRIFQTIMGHHFLSKEFDEEVRPLAEPLAIATLNLYKQIQENFMPTPTRCHYVFNLRDLSKIVQGICQTDKFACENKTALYRLWVHECMRIFSDRMISDEDRAQLKSFIGTRLELDLQSNLKDCTNANEQDTVFIDFIDETNIAYQEVPDKDHVRKCVEEKLQKYNETIRGAPMNIVLFNQAILNTCKIHRIIKLSRGHGLLIGDGGSGRHSLARLAASIAGYKMFQIEIRKGYDDKAFRESLKEYCREVGSRKRPGVFLFSDNEILSEAFVEDVNSLISTGEVPNLYSKDEIQEIKERCKKEAKVDSDEVAWNFFLTRLQSNFHVLFCMAKTGENLRNYTRMYPGLVNNTTIVWFMPWPEEALYEVADRFIAGLEVEESIKKSIAQFFSNAHTNVIQYAERMLQEQKRLYYVTPTNYVELVKGYVDLLEEKRKEIGFQINKLATGLGKLEAARLSVEQLTGAVEVALNDQTQKQKDCEELMIRVTQSAKDAEEKGKEIEVKTALLEKENIETQAKEEDAQADLDRAMPALLDAQTKIEKLTNQEFAEVRAYPKPPESVGNVMAVILIYMGHTDTSWANAKKVLSEANFVNRIKDFSKEQRDHITTKTLQRVEKFTSRAEMDPVTVMTISKAAGVLWEWCLAMEKYAKAFRDIEPKRNKVKTLKEKLKKSQEELFALQDKYRQLIEEKEKLAEMLIKARADMDKYRDEAAALKIKLERGEKLLHSLASSKDRWTLTRKDLEEQFSFLVGDCLISAAFLSYGGPFPSEYRKRLVQEVLLETVRALKIPHSRRYNFADFLSKPDEVQKWNGFELPTDQFSKENGVLVTKGRRYPLMIDPQLQANKWIKNMEKGIKVVDPQDPHLMKVIEEAISSGKSVLVENLGEEIDPALEPVLNKAIKKLDGKMTLMLYGEEGVSYNPNFKLFLTTKYSNPRYKAEVSTKVTLVNFIVKEDGLEDQLLDKVTEVQEPQLEAKRKEYVRLSADNQKILKDLDDEVLRLLNDTQTSLLDDDSLVKTLQHSKEKEDEIKQQVDSIKAAITKTENLRNAWRKLGKRASHLFFVLNDMNKIDHMYQFALDSYIQLFIESNKKKDAKPTLGDSLQDKIEAIDNRHKQNVYQYACRSLFEKDKLLFSMQMAVRLAQIAEKPEDQIDMDEYDFFLRGAVNVDRVQQPPNPAPDWIDSNAWDNICDLDKRIPIFQNIALSFMHNTKEWSKWFKLSKPEEPESLPGDWANKCDELRTMILIKILRRDRLTAACRGFIAKRLTDYYIKPPPLNLEALVVDPKPREPIIIILSPGVDPLDQIQALSLSVGTPLFPLSLGQGQTKKAQEKIIDGIKNGYWVFLANCHLSLSFLSLVEKSLETLPPDSTSKFKLWLSTNPHPKFPISLLQKSVKITTEPPKGLKANMLRLYSQLTDDDFKVEDKKSYKKLLWCLCWFHSIIIERKRFKSLGWNIIYDFNDSDFSICEKIIKQYLPAKAGQQDAASKIQWEAIRYLIAEANYGGRVTDQCDRELMVVYAKEFFNEQVLTQPLYKLGEPRYYVPDESDTQKKEEPKGMITTSIHAFFYEQRIKEFDDIDPPEAYGQHVNAEISSQISDSNILLESILALQPKILSQGAQNQETVVSDIIKDFLETKVPEPFDMYEINEKTKHINNDDPLKIVLFQEISRYNKLLNVVRLSLENLEKGIKGIILISEDLEKIMGSLFENKVPEAWKFAYHSLKPLSSWIKDLKDRIDMLKNWAMKGQPNVFWISGFTYPTGFTTAILQISARRLGTSIDNLGWDHQFLNLETVNKPPPDGAYIRGLFLEGAKWDVDKNMLIEPETMKLRYHMPIIHFRPSMIESKKTKKAQNVYKCPTYMYPIRKSDGDRPSFMFYVNLPCGPAGDPAFWVKRGTALLMSTERDDK